MDLSSELIHALLPLYLSVGLGVGMVAIGLLEGAAEATALILRVFSGVLSDWMGRRKPLVLLGYGLAALTKLVFPLAPTNMTGRPFYEDLRHHDGLHFSEPDIGRVNKQRFFSFTRRRATADDTFDGVISVSVNPAYFEAFYNTILETPTDSVALVRSDGLLLVGVPPLPPPANAASYAPWAVSWRRSRRVRRTGR